MVPVDLQARELGPFASARQLVQGRAAAMAARTEKILKDASAAREEEEVLPPLLRVLQASGILCHYIGMSIASPNS
jgi:hypothetical protein